MLSLGSLEADAACLKHIRRKFRLLFKTSQDKAFLELYQKKRLNWLLKKGISKSPFYRHQKYTSLLLTETPEKNISQFPLLEKFQFRKMSAEFIVCKDLRKYFELKTSGSTGIPLRTWFDKEYFISYFAYLTYVLRINNLWPAPLTYSTITLSTFRQAKEYQILQAALNHSFCHYFSLHPSHQRSPREIVELISREAPLILVSSPSGLTTLMNYAQEFQPIQPIRPKIILSIMETLLPSMRQKFEKFYCAPVFNEYGLTEVGGAIAIECEEQRGFHINNVDFYVETVDSNGFPVPDGTEGEIIVTNLYNSTVPLLRYRTGDYGIITHEICRCGSAAPRISQLKGRAITLFLRPDDSRYNPFDLFGEILMDLPLSQFQMVQRKIFQITLYYSGNQDIAGHALTRKLNRLIKEVYSGQAEFSIERVERFDHEGKFQSFLHLE